MRVLFGYMAVLLVLASCASGPASTETREVTARKIAARAGMEPIVIEAGAFRLAGFARFGAAGEPARVYIEGDGLAWLGYDEVSPDPTPDDPVALRLAAEDGAGTVVYLARPCQFPAMIGQAGCDAKYWTGGRTAAEVVEAYKGALDSLKARYGISGFELTGFSGGAAVAALAAAGRGDVLSLRTVAGNLDYGVFTRMHEVSPMRASVDPVSAASALRGVPQVHFIGGKDNIVFPEVVEGWRAASGDARCIAVRRIEGNGHGDGWAEMWRELLRVPVRCG